MAGGLDEDDDGGLSGINVVPLVDIMLVLLIIFMVSTEFVQAELKNKIPPNIPVELPKAASAIDTNPSLLSLVINRTGDLYLNGQPSDLPKVKLYIDGVLAAEAPAPGARRSNKHPFYVGADPDERGRPVDALTGLVDEVRISSGARYLRVVVQSSVAGPCALEGRIEAFLARFMAIYKKHAVASFA